MRGAATEKAPEGSEGVVLAIDGWKALPVRGVATTSPQKYKGAYLNFPALGRQSG